VNDADKLAQSLRSQPGFLSCKDVAVLLHVSPATVSRWARAQRLPYIRTLGGHRRYPTDAIARLVEQLARMSVEYPEGQRL
jgi:excisionase family DNA binding protein